MRSKYWIMLVLLLFVSMYLLLIGRKNSENKDTTTLSEKNNIVNKNQSDPPSIQGASNHGKNNRTQPNSKANEQATDDELDEWLKQLQNRRYSEDTSVEITSLAMEYESCGNNNSQWLYENMNVTEKQQLIINTMDKQCKQLVKDYPLLEDNQKNAGVDFVFNKFPANTELGSYLQHHFINSGSRPDNIEFGRGLVPLALKEGNAQMLYMADWLSRFSLKSRLFDDEVILGQHQEYLRTIQSIALTALSCDFQNGITCSPSARFMSDKCFADEKFCGLDFNQWYEKAVTPGMDADIQLLKQHFQSQVP